MNKYSLVIVDLQYDFYNPNGSLYVNGAETLPEKIVNFVKEHKDEISEVIFTLDWHPINHCSFTENGGQWPIHCVQNSVGAGIPQNVIKSIEGIPVHFLHKGTHTDIEQYGAADLIYVKYAAVSTTEYAICGKHNKYYQNVLTESTKFAVCGLCGDYCVKETMKNLMSFKPFTVVAIPSLTLSIDGGEKFNNFINENNIKTI